MASKFTRRGMLGCLCCAGAGLLAASIAPALAAAG